MAKDVKVFDTTLRDGAQTPGVAWTPKQKFKMARLIDSLGVDVIEFGFPRAVPTDIELGQRLAKAGMKAELCALAMPTTKDIDLVLQSGAKRVNIFVSCSRIQAQALGQLTPLSGAKKTLETVRYARAKGLKVEVTMMDAVRAEKGFLKIFARHLEKAGAQMLTLSDTVGSLDVFKTKKLFAEMRKVVKVPLSSHAHNDRDSATTITMAAVSGGAKQVHVAVAGLGDKTGNASLESVILNLKDQMGVNTNVKIKPLGPTIQKIAQIGKFEIPAGRAFIGWRARAHSSGLHIRAPEGFEPFAPERIGLKREILYGSGSDTKVVEMLAKQVHKQLTPDQIKAFTAHLKKYGSRGMALNQTQAQKLLQKRMRRMK